VPQRFDERVALHVQSAEVVECLRLTEPVTRPPVQRQCLLDRLDGRLDLGPPPVDRGQIVVGHRLAQLVALALGRR
jgi:hypothetical protein